MPLMIAGAVALMQIWERSWRVIVSIARRARCVALTRPATALDCFTEVSRTANTASSVIMPIAMRGDQLDERDAGLGADAGQKHWDWLLPLLLLETSMTGLASAAGVAPGLRPCGRQFWTSVVESVLRYSDPPERCMLTQEIS